MSDKMLFFVAFLSQVLVISYYLAGKVVRLRQWAFETYPPAEYPRLYARSADAYPRERRRFGLANRIILVIGLALLGAMLVSPRVAEWGESIAFGFFFLQLLPAFLLDLSLIRDARLLRARSSIRRAGLRPRRLLDYLSWTDLGIWAGGLAVFAALIVYVDQFNYPWFGGYANIVGVVMGDLFLLAVVSWQLRTSRTDPHQAPEDRRTFIETTVRILLTVSVASKVLIALVIVLAAMGLRAYQPAAQSVFIQVLALVSFQTMLLRPSRPDVYRQDPVG